MCTAAPVARTTPTRPPVERARILVAFTAVALIGVMAGAIGVLLPEQMAEFGVDKATIGLTFFMFSTGYVITATANGVLLHRLGIRRHLAVGTAATLLAAAGLILPAGFVALLALQVVLGLGMGLLDAGFNSYLSTLSRPAALLNYFHAFFGVGALLGPIAAAVLVEHGFSWRAFFAAYAVAMALQLVALACFPRAGSGPVADEAGRPRLGLALRLRVVLILAAFLGVYVGVEASVGNWAFSYLTKERGQEVLAAGWTVSGYWFGLTLGRFTLNALAERISVGLVALSTLCIGGVGVAAVAVWVLPSTAAATVGLAAMGFFLGPLFPTTIAIVPRLVPADLVATSIGLLVATSIAGGAALPWVVGLSAEQVGLWSLLPWSTACAVTLGLIWWRIGLRLRHDPTDR
jgi:fucose permease